MAKLVWDQIGEHIYETGTDHGVIYPTTDEGTYGTGVAWNGLTGVTESPDGADVTDLWADNIKYASIRAAETFGGTIEAYTYPDEFAECDGSPELVPGVSIGQQARKTFGFSYRTKVGNEIKFDEYGYKIHLVYGASVSPSEKAYETINDSPDAITFSWEFTTVPVEVVGFKPTALLTIDSTKVDATKLAAIEAILYGGESEEPRLPLPDEVANILGPDSE